MGYSPWGRTQLRDEYFLGVPRETPTMCTCVQPCVHIDMCTCRSQTHYLSFPPNPTSATLSVRRQVLTCYMPVVAADNASVLPDLSSSSTGRMYRHLHPARVFLPRTQTTHNSQTTETSFCGRNATRQVLPESPGHTPAFPGGLCTLSSPGHTPAFPGGLCALSPIYIGTCELVPRQNCKVKAKRSKGEAAE